MSRTRWSLYMLVLGAAVALLAACGGNDQAGEGADTTAAETRELAPIRVGISTWIGFAPLALAEEKGFWKERGLDAGVIRIEDATERFAAMRAGDTQASATTVDSWARYAGLGTDAQLVLATAESTGGDGIVALKSIPDVKAFAGQKVAVQLGITSQFLLAYALQQSGLSMDDVEVVDMDAGAAGAAFAAKRVPIAVTWQPWLSKAEQSDFGHVVVSSRDFPGLLVDAIGFPSEFIAENEEAVAAFVQGYIDALRYMRTHPTEANEIMAKFVGMEVDDFRATLADVRFLTESEIASYFERDSEVGVYQSFASAASFWQETGVIDEAPDPEQFVVSSFVEQYVR